MNSFSKPFLPSLGKTAALVAFSFVGLNVFGAMQPGPVAALSPAATGAPAAAEEDIIDIRGPIHIPAAFPWLAWGTGTLAVAGLGLGAWPFFRRRPRRKRPYELALEKLEATRPYMQLSSAQPFSRAVSEIVRLFIEECFPVRAAHRTTNEFLRDLVRVPDSPLAAHRETLTNFLEHCDLAKFARWSLTLPQMEKMLGSAAAFVIAIGKPSAPAQPIAAVPKHTAAAAAANS